MNRPIYAVHAGFVYSSDGDKHWVDARRVAELYQLPLGSWFEWTWENALGQTWYDHRHLYPRDDGNYDLMEENGNRKQRP